MKEIDGNLATFMRHIIATDSGQKNKMKVGKRDGRQEQSTYGSNNKKHTKASEVEKSETIKKVEKAKGEAFVRQI